MKDWLSNIIAAGLVPYIATSKRMVSALECTHFEGKHVIKLLENPDDLSFHHAYLLSNSLGFGSPDLKMPNWVYIDCVLMQTAVVGFALPVDKAPDELLAFYRADPNIDVDRLDLIPVSGQIANMGLDGNTITGYSIFALKQWLKNHPAFTQYRIGTLTKYLALMTYGANQHGRTVRGIAQYDNHAVKLHGAFAKKMYIEQPMVPLHPKQDMSFTYYMQADFDDERILQGATKDSASEPDYWMHCKDTEFKLEMQHRIAEGERFYIKDPLQQLRNNEIYLPICVEK